MPDLESRRLAALKAFRILDTPAEESFDRIVSLAGDLFDAPIALVSLIDEDRQWFKARLGLDACSTGREWAFCAHVIDLAPDTVMVVEDATLDPRFARNPFVTGAPGIRFYAGANLTTRDGYNLGTLCVIDTKPRLRPSEASLRQLRRLAQIVVDQIESAHLNARATEKQRLLAMAETMSGVGHWRLNTADNSVTWSDMVYTIHGVRRDAFDPNLDSAVNFYHPDDRDTVSANLAMILENKGGFDSRLRLIRADGEIRHVVAKAACELDDRGAVSAIFGLFQDVTDQVESTRALASSEARYRLLAENASDIIAEFGRDGIFHFISPACQAVLGYTPEELIGSATWKLIHEDDAPGVLASYVALKDAGPGGSFSVRVRYRARHRDGRWIWLEGRPRAIFDAVTGEPTSYQDAARDITAEVAAEEALRQAKADAETAAGVKAEFLANMSHELRTPLTAVLGFSRLISEQPELTPVTRRFVARASSAGSALLSTINDILDFSKLEAGQLEIRRRPVALQGFFSEISEMFAAQVEEKGLVFASEPASGLPDRLALDPDRVRQIVLNLMGNALKFTEHGHIALDARYDDETSTLRIAVSDTGPGIEPDRIDRLFRRFSQVDGTSTRRHGGTGLGLAICKGLVDAMGGEIGVATVPGAGASFWFTLPAVRANAAPHSHFDSGPRPSLPDGCRLLLADDNASTREIASALIDAFGIELVQVSDGLAAVAAASTQPFDVILMDLCMPGLDGETAARQIREGGGLNASIPIIAFTASPLDAPPSAVFDGLATKPFTAATLAAEIARTLEAGSLLDAAA